MEKCWEIISIRTLNQDLDSLKGNPPAPLMELQIGAASMENNMEVPQKKLKIILPYDPAISLLSIYRKKFKTLI